MLRIFRNATLILRLEHKDENNPEAKAEIETARLIFSAQQVLIANQRVVKLLLAT